MARLLIPALLVALAAPAAHAQVRSAAELLEQAQVQARQGDRAVLVLFHASWCSWCRRLEGVFAQPQVKAVLDRHFVIQWLTILERGPKAELDNPGAADLYQSWTHGTRAGIPFYGVLDAKGTLKASSLQSPAPGAPAENLGYPGTTAEIKLFVGLLKAGAPTLTEAEAATLTSALEAAKPRA